MKRLVISVRAITLVFTNRDLGRLQVAWAAMAFATWGFVIVLSVYAFDAGGAGAVGLVAAIRLLPGVLATPLAGLAADRYSRRATLIASACAGTIVLGAVALAVSAGSAPWVVYTLAGLYTVTTTPYIPAEGALLPLVSRTPQELSAANVAHSAMDSGGFLAGSVVVAILMGSFGFDVAFAATATAGVAAIAALLGVRSDRRPDYTRAPVLARAFHELDKGARCLLEDAGLRLAAAVAVLLSFFEGAADVLAVVIVLDLLHLGESSVGYLNAAWGVGALIGGAALAVLLERARLAAALGSGCIILGAACALPGAWPVAVAAFVGWLGIGLGHTLADVSSRTLLQRLGSDETLARVLATLETARLGALALGSLVAPLAVALLGTRGALIAVAAVLPAFAAMRWRALRGAEIGSAVPERPYRLLREDPIFSPLPVATVERVSRELKPLCLAAGSVVITQGDVGSLFYLIDSGEVEVFDGSVHCRTQGAGESFGEIALIRDIPRTATVSTRTETRLLCLGRDEFIAAVTGHARSHQSAEETASKRLGAAAASEVGR